MPAKTVPRRLNLVNPGIVTEREPRSRREAHDHRILSSPEHAHRWPPSHPVNSHRRKRAAPVAGHRESRALDREDCEPSAQRLTIRHVCRTEVTTSRDVGWVSSDAHSPTHSIGGSPSATVNACHSKRSPFRKVVCASKRASHPTTGDERHRTGNRL